MKEKNFYKAFNVLYESVKDGLGISQKEEFYRVLFRNIYLMAEDDLYDNDVIRKITTGNSTIHRKVVKILCTDEGFEVLRKDIEILCLSKLSNKARLVLEMKSLLNADIRVPNNIKQQVDNSVMDDSDYQLSRAIAAILICLNHSDYIYTKGKEAFFNVDFMRLSSDRPILKYPRYISNSPNVALEELIGREKELGELYTEIINNKGKIMISAVGGLGKTELVKLFLRQVMDTEVKISGIEMIAWISYNNQDIRLSIKQALNWKCDLEEVWLKIQDMASEHNKRLLLVIDNIENIKQDTYLQKLGELQCRIVVTSRQKNLIGFTKVMGLQPLQINDCRNLFYKHYKFVERDNEVLNDIINLTAKLTIMIVFIAKVAYLEGMSLHELYRRLVEKGFKLSDEDVSCEHEKMQNDDTVIRQMCILFSIITYNEEDKRILTCISVIPNLQFTFKKAKNWFQVPKNSNLIKLFNMGMLEHITKDKVHIYWMHSVIAAAIREQQKDKLYMLSRPFVNILSEELNTGPLFGREYEKAYLIPFSWSVADIMELHWNDENDSEFLNSLFHVCFACSNYALCEKLIDIIIRMQRNTIKFSYMELAYSYRNKVDMLLQFDRAAEASLVLEEIEQLFNKNNALEEEREILNSQYGILYQIRGNYKKSYFYFDKCIQLCKNSNEETKNKDLSTAYSNMARMLLDSGDFLEAYDYIKKAIDVQKGDDTDSDLIISYSILGSICTELMNAGYESHFIQEAESSFKKVIEFREKYLGKHHADTAVVYHDYAYFLYIVGQYDKALKYNKMASGIDEELFSDHSITRMRGFNTRALIIWEQGKYQEANEIFDYIIEISEQMSDDYLVDVADFEFNYARCLCEQAEDKKAIEFYNKCISIWSKLSENRNRKLAMAYKECADIFFSKGKILVAVEYYQKAMIYITEDFYLMVDTMDNMAACLLLNQQIDEGIDEFKRLLEILVEYNVKDDETKFQLCNNLLCILDAVSEDELKWKNRLMEQIKGEEVIMEYVNNFFRNMEEK